MEYEPWRLAYLAGLIDGEGCVTLHQHTPSSNNMTTELQVSNTNKKLMLWLVENFPEGSLTPVPLSSRGKERDWAQGYRWSLRGQKSLPLLRAVLPYLVIKKRQMELLIEFLSPDLCPGKGVKYTDHQINERVRILNEVRRLNQLNRGTNSERESGQNEH